jgi:ParB family transcriptional regulator, chromosome partitioning protein
MAEKENKLAKLVKVRSFEDIFAKTGSGEECIFDDGNIGPENDAGTDNHGSRIKKLSIDSLVAFAEHPFRLYIGKKLDDMVESIKENGVMTPLIVRRKEDGKYEILSGHNRANAARLAGLDKVPAIIKEDISDAEAKIIVTDTNFMQRSIADMLPSELAKSLKMQLEACKEAKQKQALVNDVENSEDPHEIDSSEQGAPVGHLQKSRDIIAENNNMGRENIRRYIRLNYLVPSLLDKVDEGQISLRPAVDLSYLKEIEQQSVFEALNNSSFKVDMAKAEKLRSLSESGKLDDDKIFEVLSGEYNKKKKPFRPAVKKSINISYKRLTPYFDKDTDVKEIEEEIIKALEFYRKAHIADMCPETGC